MHLYDIGYGTCEESHYWQYWHEKEYSKEELRDIIVACLIETIQKLADRVDGDGRNYDTLQFDDGRFMPVYCGEEGITFQEAMGTKLFHDALESRGFARAEFTTQFSTFGWASCMREGSWESHSDNERGEIIKRIKEATKDVKIVEREKHFHYKLERGK